MEQNKKGSILIYVLFLSSFLVLFFISFQGELINTLESSKNSELSIQNASRIQDALILSKNAPYTGREIDIANNLILVPFNQDETTFTHFLGGNDSEEYWINSTGGSTPITITVQSGGPIVYHICAFNSGSESSSVIIGSGSIKGTNNISLSGSYDQHLLVIDSVGGSTEYVLNTHDTTTIPSSTYYRTERNIKGYIKTEGIYTVKNFLPKSRSNIDYQKMGMYLK